VQLPAGLNASDMVMTAIRTGSVGVFILLAGRILRRSKGLAVHLWLLGGFLTILGIAVASGIIDVDMSRTLELARLAREVVSWGRDVFASTLVGVAVPARVVRTSRRDGREHERTRNYARTGTDMASREVACTGAGERSA